ncbi:MAG: ABC-2 family transporter protein [Methanomassiliicoccales archaeon PtaB.Bin215]|nr:MAG: ABC-2 family transporter protein [Methanomassiliicoccales archaeon PtaB.Bin215]
MNSRRTWAITKKVLRSLRHDRRTAAFLVLMPIFMIAIFGYTFGGEVEDVAVYVIDMDEGVGPMDISDLMIDHLQADGSLRVVKVVRTSDGFADPIAYGREKVGNGEAWGCIAFPADFTSDVITFAPGNSTAADAATLTLFLDGSNFNIAQTVTGAVRSALSDVMTQDLGVAQPVNVVPDMVYGEGRDFLDTFAPGVISLAVMMVTFMISIISFIHERTTGTLARLLSTPVTEAEVVTGYALAFGLIGLVQSAVVLATALLLFGVQVEGSILLVLLTVFMLGVGMQGLGFLLSANARTEFQAVQFIPIVLFPSILLSGVFWPLESVPEVLRPISYLLPLTYAVDGVRSVMLRGWGLQEIWPDVTVLLLFAAAMLTLSIALMRRR